MENEEIFKNAIKLKTKDTLKYAIKNIDDTYYLKKLVIEYLKNKYDLQELLRINNPNLKYALIACIDENNFIIYDVEDSIILKKAGFNDVLLQIEYKYETLSIAILTQVYDEKVMQILFDEDKLHLLYKKTKDFEILNFLYSKKIEFKHFSNFKEVIDKENRLKLLNIINKGYGIDEVLNNINYFDKEDLMYLCNLNLSKLDIKMSYQILLLQSYYESDRKILLNKILLSNNPEYIYKVLTNNILKLEEKKEFEDALKRTKNFEYNFYYNFIKNKNKLIIIFGGYIALESFLLNNYNNFVNKEEYLKIVSLVKSLKENEVQKTNRNFYIDNNYVNKFAFLKKIK